MSLRIPSGLGGLAPGDVLGWTVIGYVARVLRPALSRTIADAAGMTRFAVGAL